MVKDYRLPDVAGETERFDQLVRRYEVLVFGKGESSGRVTSIFSKIILKPNVHKNQVDRVVDGDVEIMVN